MDDAKEWNESKLVIVFQRSMISIDDETRGYISTWLKINPSFVFNF